MTSVGSLIKPHLLLALFCLLSLGSLGEVQSASITDCHKLCDKNQTNVQLFTKCIHSCSAMANPEIASGDEDSVRNPSISESSIVGLDRVIRSSDAVQFMGPYQRRPHYLRIGRSAGDNKRARPPYYLRIGRGDVDESELNVDKRGRPSHYLRIGRSNDLSQAGDVLLSEKEMEKRSRPSYYLRIGRDWRMNQDSSQEGYDKRARPSHYLRIGRDLDDEMQLSDKNEQNKRAKPSHYLRIGRNSEDDKSFSHRHDESAIYDDSEEDHGATPALSTSVLEVDPSGKLDEKRNIRQSHYLRIGRISRIDSDDDNSDNIIDVQDSAEKRSRQRLGHYLRIGR